jgi:hypothetical protein
VRYPALPGDTALRVLLPSPRSRLPSPRSRLPRPRSRLPRPRSRLPGPRSRLPGPRSRLPRPRSRLPRPRTRLPRPRTRLPRPRRRVWVPRPVRDTGSRQPGRPARHGRAAPGRALLGFRRRSARRRSAIGAPVALRFGRRTALPRTRGRLRRRVGRTSTGPACRDTGPACRDTGPACRDTGLVRGGAGPGRAGRSVFRARRACRARASVVRRLHGLGHDRNRLDPALDPTRRGPSVWVGHARLHPCPRRTQLPVSIRRDILTAIWAWALLAGARPCAPVMGGGWGWHAIKIPALEATYANGHVAPK